MEKQKFNKKLNNYDKSQNISSLNLPYIYQEFSKSLPKEAEQEGEFAYGLVKGYKYQYIVNRLNKVVGFNHWHIEYQTKEERVGQSWEVYCSIKLMLGNWERFEDKMTTEQNSQITIVPLRRIEFVPIVLKEHVGKCTNQSKGWAIMGSIDNAIKKCAALYGIGKTAYEGFDLDFIDSSFKKNESIKSEKPSHLLSINQGTFQQQDVFKSLLTSLNSIRNKEDLIKFKEVLKTSDFELTIEQNNQILQFLAQLEKKL